MEYSVEEDILILQEDPHPNIRYAVKDNDGEHKYWLDNDGDNVKLIEIDTGKVIGQVDAPDEFRDNALISRIVLWLYRKSPDSLDIQEVLEQRGDVVVKGHVQSGKTNFMLCTALVHLFRDLMSSVIVLRDSRGDFNQIANRIKETVKSLSDYLARGDIEIKILMVDSHLSDVEFDLAMECKSPRLIVVLGNGSQLARINRRLEAGEDNKEFLLFIDEADANDAGDSARAQQVLSLCQKAKYRLHVSATVLELGLKNELDVGGVHIMRDVPHYMGLDKLQPRYLKDGKAAPCNKVKDVPSEKDPNISEFLDFFAELEPHYIDLFSCYHPQHCLISCGATIEPQRRLMELAANREGITVVVYNGDGIDLYSESLVSENVVIDGYQSMECPWMPGGHRISSRVGYSSVIQFLKDLGGVERFPRILTISGKLAGRGISFTSRDYGKYLANFSAGTQPTWVGWRLTSMYIIPSSTASQPFLMQITGRVCCIVRDNIPTYVYTTRKTFRDIRKAYWAQEELIARARGSREAGSSFRDAILAVKMQKNKLSKRPLTLSELRRLPAENLVQDDSDQPGAFRYSAVYEVPDTVTEEWDNSAAPEDDSERQNAEMNNDNDIRRIRRDIIGDGTIACRMYTRAFEIIGNSENPEEWKDRSFLTGIMVSEGELGSRARIEAHLKYLYQRKYTKEFGENEPGLYMRKAGGLVQLRVQKNQST